METYKDAAMRSQLHTRREQLVQAITQTGDNQQLVRLLQDVDAALERIDNGKLGICDVCHEPIEDRRLQVEPFATICLSHLSKEQQDAFERDLELASAIQRKLLPDKQERIDGWEVHYHYEPAGLVSGDYCDLIKPESKGRDAYILFGDVSGKGVAASLLMSRLHAIFRSLIISDLSFHQLVEKANKLFCDSTLSAHFATLVSAKVSKDGDVEICNAGHCPPLLIRNGQVTSISSTGIPVGMFCDTRYELKNLNLNKGDTLLLYTDGLTETRNPSGEDYSEERLTKFVADNHHLIPSALISACLADFNTFRSGASKVDDLTIMVLRRNG
ncbi:MAG: SpoIIE family protein phosphatase [Ignavibacteriae bacterium]|nr:SpoIIE family protein phosphatase [Ignavibacteriota bacterium]